MYIFNENISNHCTNKLSVTYRYFRSLVITLIALVVISGCTSVEDERWERAERRNSVASYQQFAQQHPTSKNAIIANQRAKELYTKQEQSAFDGIKIEHKNAKQKIKQYIRKYPKGPHHKDVLSMRDKMRFNNAKKDNNDQSYNKYLKENPEGSFVNEANAALENFKQIRIKKLYNQLVVSKDYNQISSFIKTHPNYPNIEKLKARQSRFTKIVTKKAQTVSYKALGWPKPMTGEELMMLDKEDEKNRIINMHGRMTGGLIVFTRKYLHVLIGNGTIPGIDDTLEPVNITYQMLRNDVPKISSISEKGFFVINRLVVLPVGSTLNIKSVFVNNGIIDQGVIVLGEKKAILKSGAIQYLYNN